MKTLIVIFSVLLISSCKGGSVQPLPTVQKNTVTSKPDQNFTSRQTAKPWTDSAIVAYISQSDNELVKAFRNDSTPIEWMLDRTENTDTAKYFIYQISHSNDHKLSTLAWLYVDTATRTIYEYDVASDSLLKWRDYPYR